MTEPYRIILPRIYEDEKARGMIATQHELEVLRLNNEIIAGLIGNARHSLFVFLINNIKSINCITGIYEMPRGSVAFFKEIPLEIVEDSLGMSEERACLFFNKKSWKELSEEQKEFSLGYYNRKKPFLLEYDREKHVVYVKSFFKYNFSSYERAEKLSTAIKKDFENTYQKCPRFWTDFVKNNKKILLDTRASLSETGNSYKSYSSFLEKLLLLNDNFEEVKPLSKTTASSSGKLKDILKISSSSKSY